MVFMTFLKNNIYLVIGFLLFCMLVFMSFRVNKLTLIGQTYECKKFICSYKVFIKNNTSLKQVGYLKIKVESNVSSSLRSSNNIIVNKEKRYIEIVAEQTAEFTGEIKTPISGVFLSFFIYPEY